MASNSPDSWDLGLHDEPYGLLYTSGMEVQIYRRREDDRTLWKYLDNYWDDRDIELQALEGYKPAELDGLAPLEWTSLTHGGGDYQFRFRWRDEQGQKRLIKSRDIRIDGRPAQRSGAPIVQEGAPDRLAELKKNVEKLCDERTKAAALEEELVFRLLLQQYFTGLRAAERHVQRANQIEFVAAIVTGLCQTMAPLLEGIPAKSKRNPLDLDGLVPLTLSLKELPTDTPDPQPETISLAYRRRPPLSRTRNPQSSGAPPDSHPAAPTADAG